MPAPDATLPRFPRLSPRQDLVFKLLFSRNRALLVNMLEAVLGRKIRSVEVLNPDLPADVTNAKIVALDLRVVLDDGSRVDVEMQARALPDNPARFLSVQSVVRTELAPLAAAWSSFSTRSPRNLRK